MLNSLEKGIVGIRNQDTVDFAAFDQRKCAFPHEFEERSQRSVVISSCCQVFVQPFAPGATLPIFRLDTSNGQPPYEIGGVAVQKAFVASFAVFLFSSGLAWNPCNFSRQLLETL